MWKDFISKSYVECMNHGTLTYEIYKDHLSRLIERCYPSHQIGSVLKKVQIKTPDTDEIILYKKQ